MSGFRVVLLPVLWALLSSGCLKPYSPSVVGAEPSPYESRETLDYVKRLERKGVPVEDWLGPASREKCAVHGMKMEVVTVPGLDGEVLHTRPYDEAREKYFPNSGISYPPELYSRTQLGKIHVCAKCISAVKTWSAANS